MKTDQNTLQAMKTFSPNMQSNKFSSSIAMLLMLLLFPCMLRAQITITKQDATCGLSDGSATASVSHGVPPYKYAWSNGQSGATATKLAKGTYWVTVTDSVGCKGKKSVFIKNSGGINVSISGGGSFPYCLQDGPPQIILSASASGGTPPYTYSPSQTLTVSASGTYSIGALDEGSCFGRSKVQVTVIPVRCSRDPNEILGPDGFGPEKFIAAKNTIPYIINFENDPDFATAPAQKVTVTHEFDPHINMYSLRLGEFGFRNLLFNVPPNSSSYSTRLDVRDSLGIFVDVTAGINVGNHTAFWIFQSIDPATGMPPEDPMVGFLPINDSISHHGEGYVSFSVKPKTNTFTGDSIKAMATIVFDLNPPISTNRWFNTADVGAPVSHINLLPDSVPDNYVDIEVTANDDDGGSGVGTVEIWASEAGQAYVKAGEISPDSTFRFTGNACTAYHFYSIAIDNTGNEEPTKVNPEAIVVLNPAPAILSSPIDATISEGENINFSCTAMGGISFTWEVSNDGGVNYSVLSETAPYSGTETPILGITNAPASLNGSKYRCLVSNGSCFSYSNAASLLLRASLYGQLKYDNEFASPISNTQVFLMDFNGQKVDSVNTNLSGSYLFDLIEPGTYTLSYAITKPWGGVNATDALNVLRHFAQMTLLEGLKLKAADVNASNTVNSIDALLIAKRFVALIGSFATGDWYTRLDTVVLGTLPQAMNFTTICYGDVNASYIPGLKAEPSIGISEKGIIKLMPGESFAIPFSVNRPVNAAAMSFIFTYPNEMTEITEIGLKTKEATQELIFTTEKEFLRIGWYSLTPINIETGEVMFTISGVFKDKPVSQELSFVLDACSEVANAKAMLEKDLILTTPKLTSGEIASSNLILNQNYPNPFRHSTEISYYLPEEGTVLIKIYNTMGEAITELVKEQQASGWHRISFDASGIAPGSYPFKMDFEGKNNKFSVYRILSKIN